MYVAHRKIKLFKSFWPPPIIFHAFTCIANITRCLNCLVFDTCLPNMNYQILYVPDCARPLGLQDNKNRIRSPASLTNPNYPPDAARLNGLSAWCPSRTPAYLQIDLDKTYKLTAIATQGGTVRNKWVHRYTISFNAGENIIDYTESGSTKVRPAPLLFSMLSTTIYVI